MRLVIASFASTGYVGMLSEEHQNIIPVTIGTPKFRHKIPLIVFLRMRPLQFIYKVSNWMAYPQAFEELEVIRCNAIFGAKE